LPPADAVSETPFVITVDTEGDDIWSRPREITTHNARCLPRFQTLCERYGFRPVYLANYEMANCAEFVDFARDVLNRDAGEIGMHLHAWNTPPLVPRTDDDFRYQPYLTEYPDDVMRAKIRVMTVLLEERFGRRVVSHRAGRFGFDGRYAAMLLEEGYLVDCSVTPGVDWSTTPGAPDGAGGPDYRAFPDHPYFLTPGDIATPARRGLLEVPVTIGTSGLYRAAPWAYRLPVAGPIFNRISPMRSWACPGENGLAGMLRAARAARAGAAVCVEFLVHSSELMPGGSPRFRASADIERLYASLEVLFEDLAAWCRGTTLAEFYSAFAMVEAA
jgi:hypothetical protein